MSLFDQIPLPTFSLYGLTCQGEEFVSINFNLANQVAVFRARVTLLRNGEQVEGIQSVGVTGTVLWNLNPYSAIEAKLMGVRDGVLTFSVPVAAAEALMTA